jgi:hypothetical protein
MRSITATNKVTTKDGIKRGIAALALALAAPAWAQTALPSTTLSGTRFNDGPRAMLYWHLPLDAARTQAAQVGLRLDNAVQVAGHVRSLPLLDLRLTGGRTTFKTLGAIAFDSSDLGTTDSLKNPYFWLAVTVGALGISCLTENFPCKKHNDGSGTYSAPGD